jgi:hypothetical protein
MTDDREAVALDLVVRWRRRSSHQVLVPLIPPLAPAHCVSGQVMRQMRTASRIVGLESRESR